MKRARYLLIAAALMLPAIVSAGGPVTRVVPTDYESIQDAVDAANPGDTVMIRPGVYDENVSVDTPNLFIHGRCEAKNLPLAFQDDPTKRTLVDGGTNGNVFNISASDVHLACLTTRHGDMGINFSEFGEPRGFLPSISGFRMTRVTVLSPRWFGVYIEGDQFRVTRSRIIGSGWDGLYVSVGHGGVVENTSVRGSDGSCYYFNWSHNTEFTDNVGLDCNGYGVQMYGDDNIVSDNEFRSNAAGGYFEGDDFTVQDNTFLDSGYQDNCLSVYGSDMLVQGNEVGGCSYDGIEAYGDYAQVLDNVSSSSNDYCFDVGGEEVTFANNRCDPGSYYGIYFQGDNSLLSENVVDGALYDAFYLEGSDNEVSGNTVSRGNDGIEVYGNDNLVQGNNVSRTSWESIYVYADANPRVIENVSELGAASMIQVYCNEECDSAEVSANQVLSGGAVSGEFFRGGGGPGGEGNSGIYVDSGSGMTIDGNTVRNVRGYGFELYCDGCTVTNNNAFDNGSRRGYRAGFYIGGDSSLFTDNLATGNTGPGFLIDGSGNSIVYNSSMRNLLEGFRVTFLSATNLLDQNNAENNHSEGIDNQGVQTGMTANLSEYNRIDCANSGSLDLPTGNFCRDLSNFSTPGELD